MSSLLPQQEKKVLTGTCLSFSHRRSFLLLLSTLQLLRSLAAEPSFSFTFNVFRCFRRLIRILDFSSPVKGFGDEFFPFVNNSLDRLSFPRSPHWEQIHARQTHTTTHLQKRGKTGEGGDTWSTEPEKDRRVGPRGHVTVALLPWRETGAPQG